MLKGGDRLGSYEIESALGAGGMGEVYRAKDLRLGRAVAIKVLPDLFLTDPDRLARFQREAQILATLNHHGIAGIHGLEEAGGNRFLVLELIEGESLANRLQRGPLPLDEAQTVARQIADALEAAHDKGIIHRDLKPANIMLTPDNEVKVLDFGLARFLEQDQRSEASNSPTLTFAATRDGIILGTAAYMSPEQAKGRAADKRSDVWAFGCVLFEMLTGQRPFEGEDVSETLASILRAEPDWTALPDATPVSVRTVLKRALTKERKARLPDISVARYLLEDRAEPVHTQLSARPPAPVWRRALPLAIAAVLSAGITLAAVRAIRPVATPAPITRFQIALGEGQTWSSLSRPVVALSPDGTRLVYVADNRLFIRSMNDLKERAIVGSPTSAGTLNLLNPVFSPDGEWIAYWERNQVKKVNAAGGAPVVLGTTGPPFGMTWSGDELLLSLVEGSMRGIFRLPENGGKPELLIGMKNEEAAYGPQRLPDGKTILFTRSQGFGPDRWDRAHVLVQAPGSQAKVLFTGTAARYLPTGHIVFAVGGVLNAVRFDARRLEVLGSPVPVVEGVRRSQSVAAAAHFTVSNSGTLAYLPGSASSSALVSHLALIDRNGTVEVLKIPPGPYEIPRMSPDGTRIAFGSIEGGDAAVWVSDVSGATAPRRLTFGGRSRFPVWSADSQRVAFQSDREGDEGIFWQRADGSGQAERLTRPEKGASHVPESWSPKDERLAFIETRETTSTLWTLSVKDRTVTRFDAVESLTPTGAVFSPDGRWLVYSTRETAGQTSNIMYVQPFPPTGVKYQISPSGDDGHHAVWSRDGKELLFVPGPGRFVSMPVSIDSTFSVGSSVPVPRPFQTAGPLYTRTFDMTPTGKILGLLESSSDAAPAGTQSQIHVVLNWTEELKSRVPSR